LEDWQFDKLHLVILNILLENECLTKLNSMTINELNDKLDINKNTIYKKSIELKNQGFIAYGLKDKQANTLFITEKGKEFFEGEIN
jgi:DNA-binding transcriptional regulator YhcF (GntR family)